jgi:penicillin-binding protein 2
MDRATTRLKTLAILVTLMFVALTTRLWFLQVLAADTFRAEARNNSVRFVYTDALRGKIYTYLAGEKQPLVANESSLEVRVVPQVLAESGQGDAVLLRLSRLLKTDVHEIRMDLEDPRYLPIQPKPVAEFVPEEVQQAIDEHPELFPGVTVETTSVRSYPAGRLGAHVVGWVGQIDADELEDPRFRDYGQSDVVGKSGVEQVYEKFLRGERGVQRFIVNADGETIRALAQERPTPGNDVYLAIDRRFQWAAEHELKVGMQRARALTDSSGRSLRADAGAVVVMDAHTGAIRAMASRPSFDPSWFVRGLTRLEYRYMFKSPRAPALSRAMAFGYYPGSTFKPITGLVAIKEGVATTTGYYPCTTTYVHPGDESGAEFDNWAPWDELMRIDRALEVSCDTVFYGFGSDFYNRWVDDQFGKHGEPLQAGLREFGFGAATGVDLPAETTGLVPDSAWAQSRPDLFPDGWIPAGDIFTMIGSVYVQTSPLQIATAYAAIANGGHVCRPHVVEKVVDGNDDVVMSVPDKCERELSYTDEQLSYIRHALARVTQGAGTASCAFSTFPLAEVPVGGKTGTAEWGDERQDVSWFASLVGPTDNPDYVVVVMVDQGGFGAQTAAPIARHVIERMYGLEKTGPPVCSDRED